MRDIPTCKWLDQWTELAQKYVPDLKRYPLPVSYAESAQLFLAACAVCLLTGLCSSLQVCIPVQPIPAAQGPGGLWLHKQTCLPWANQTDHPNPQQGIWGSLFSFVTHKIARVAIFSFTFPSNRELSINFFFSQAHSFIELIRNPHLSL